MRFQPIRARVKQKIFLKKYIQLYKLVTEESCRDNSRITLFVLKQLTNGILSRRKKRCQTKTSSEFYAKFGRTQFLYVVKKVYLI